MTVALTEQCWHTSCDAPLLAQASAGVREGMCKRNASPSSSFRAPPGFSLRTRSSPNTCYFSKDTCCCTIFHLVLQSTIGGFLLAASQHESRTDPPTDDN
jgi:hypothetical protein